MNKTKITTILKTLLKEFDKQKIEGGGFKIGNKYVIIEVKESEKE